MKIILEALPLFAFFVFYTFYGIKMATIAIVIATIATTIINYIFNKSANALVILTTVIVALLGSMTVISDNNIFIKIKPTIVNMIFASILLFGIARKRGYMKNILGSKISMHDWAWITLSKRFALLFVCLAALNEVVWRSCSEDVWVSFKVFGSLIILVAFTITQAPFLSRNRLPD